MNDDMPGAASAAAAAAGCWDTRTLIPYGTMLLRP